MLTGTLAYGLASAALTLAFVGAQPAQEAVPLPQRCYVDIGAPAGGDGLAWATAYNDLQLALANATCSPIWVANGVYKPDVASPGDRALSFVISSEVAVYGGFHGDPGGETLLSQRDWGTNLTILSGDIDAALNTCGAGGDESCADVVDANGVTLSHEDIRGLNSYHVVKIDGETFEATSATRLDGFIVTAGDAGGSGMDTVAGGLYCSARNGGTCSPTLQNLAFYGNRAANGGGAIFNDTYPGGTASPSISDSSFSGNHAESAGGAIYNWAVHNGVSNPTLTDVDFTSNSSHGEGGALYSLADGNEDFPSAVSSPALTRVTFTGNSSSSGGAITNHAYGGSSSPALTDVVSSPVLMDVTFTANVGSGGGMSSTGSSGGISNPQLTDVHFVNNGPAAGGSGGGMQSMAIGGGESSPVLTSVTFEQNHAYYGGAWQSQANGGSSSPSLTDVTFRDNTGVYGGAMHVGAQDGGTNQVELNRALFIYNLASQYGGAIYHHASNASSSLSVTNAAFSRNEAGPYGGAIYNEGSAGTSSVTATNVTFRGNDANAGGALFDYALSAGSASATLRNAVLREYSFSLMGTDDIYNSGAAATVDISYTDLSGNCGSIAGATCGAGILNVDPLLVDPASDNLRLQDDSPVIDAGDNAAVPGAITADLDGQARFRDNPVVGDTGNGTAPIVDMGAYESALFCPSASEALYVDGDASGAGNGANWTDAFTHLEDALDLAETCTGASIWVAEGVYKPTDNPTDTAASFSVPPEAKVYGGFVGSETALAQRDWKNNVTVLSGDIDAGENNCGSGTDPCADVVDADGVTLAYTDIRGTNSTHVLTLWGMAPDTIDSDTVLDGFTITAGQATLYSGAGLYCVGSYPGGDCSPTLSNLRFMGNFADEDGGALTNLGLYGGQSSPSLTDVLFSGNHAFNGGAMFNAAREGGTSNPVLMNVIFRQNFAENLAGALFNDGEGMPGLPGGISNPSLMNVIFDGNVSAGDVGAIYSAGAWGESSPWLVNVAFSGNQALNGGAAAMKNGGISGISQPALYNVIMWGNTGNAEPGFDIYNQSASMSMHYSIVEYGASGIVEGGILNDPYNTGFGNRDQDPKFVDAAAGNLRLQGNSPAIDAGANDQTHYPIEFLTDLDGNPRIVDDPAVPDSGNGTAPFVDIGPYEYVFACPAGSRLYVDKDAVGEGDGSSWTNAYSSLQSALGVAAACPGLDVWVAEGLYRPSVDENQQESFVIPPGVAVYGGFAGTEDELVDRDLSAHLSVLSGDIDYLQPLGQDEVDSNGVSGSYEQLNGNNSQHVVWMDGTGASPITSSTVLDGFTITGGKNLSDDDAWYAYGGGLLCYAPGADHECSPTLSNLVFSGNYAFSGGGLFGYAPLGGVSSPSLTDVRFIGNGALAAGGAVAAQTGLGGTSSPDFTNVAFISNRALDVGDVGNGGAVWYSSDAGLGAPQFRNALFAGNYAAGLGGGLFIHQTDSPGNALLTNVTFAANEAADGGGAIAAEAFSESSPTGWPMLANVILWANMADGAPNQIHTFLQQVEVNYSIVEGGEAGIVIDGLPSPPTPFAAGMSNLDADPLFRDFDGGDFRLQPLSPATDAGNNAAMALTTDLDHAPRFADNPFVADTGSGTAPIVDMGAYEFSIVCPPAGRLYVNWEAAGLDNGTSWTDALTDLQEALGIASACPGNNEIWVAQGVYKPTNDPLNEGASFVVPPGVKVYGGFAGDEASIGFRDLWSHPTVLSGDIDDNDDVDENGVSWDFDDAYGSNSDLVVRMDGTGDNPITSTTVLDSFFITGGLHDVVVGGDSEDGAGLYCDGQGASHACSPTLQYLVFTGNSAGRGAALFLNASEGGLSEAQVTDAYFKGNFADAAGGAVYNEGVRGQLKPSFTNVTFANNQAQFGGALYDNASGLDSSSSTSLTNVTFTMNWANGSGGAVVLEGAWGDASASITNATFADNEADQGGAISTEGFGGTGTPIFTNLILWGNYAYNLADEIYNHEESPLISHSLIQDSNGSGVDWVAGLGTDMGGNLDEYADLDWLFGNGGFAPTMALNFGSPAIDTGDDAACPDTDQRWVQRPQNGDLTGLVVCDMGAYEFAAYVISGNAGVGGAALNYDIDGPMSVTANGSGGYSLLVPEHWSGAVTPYLTGYLFTPDHRDYDDVTADWAGQNYTAAPSLVAPTILRIFPVDDSEVCRRPTVGVKLLLTDMVRTPTGEFDPSTISLKIDGVDVTGLARITVNQTFPASEATILLTAATDIPLAYHDATLTYPSPTGPQTYAWGFTSVFMACTVTGAPPITTVPASGISGGLLVWNPAPAPTTNPLAGYALQNPYRRLILQR